MPLGCTDELVRPLIKNALALDELDDATRATTLHLDTSSALAKVFVIVLTEDERRVGHFRKHLATLFTRFTRRRLRATKH